jgi:hypothetical protein
VGNANTTATRTVNIDTTKPSTTDDAPAGWQTSPVTVTLTPSDATSGVASTQYKVDGASSWTSGTSVLVSGDGDHTVQYYSTDNAGNAESIKTVHVKIDGTNPVTTDDAPTAWQTSGVTVHLTPTDATSGVASTEYNLDGAGWTSGTSVAVSGDGAHTID